MIQQSASQNIRNTAFLHLRLNPTWKNKVYFSILQYINLLRWIFLPVYLSKGHCWTALICSTGKCWCSSCIRRGGTFALQHDAVSVHNRRLWFLPTSKKNETEPNRSSNAPQSAHAEKETLSAAALQWMRCSGTAQLFLGRIYFKTHCVLQVFSQIVTPLRGTKPANFALGSWHEILFPACDVLHVIHAAFMST